MRSLKLLAIGLLLLPLGALAQTANCVPKYTSITPQYVLGCSTATDNGTTFAIAGAVTAPSYAISSGATQGEPTSINASSQITSTPAKLDCSQFAGADDSVKIAACFTALYALNTQSGVADARGLTGLVWSENPFKAATHIPNSGTLEMPGSTIVTSVPIVIGDDWKMQGVSPNASNGTNYGAGAVAAGSVLQASSSFPTTYSTGTVTVGTAGLNETVTGVGTSWSTSTIAVGCAFVAPAGGTNGGNSTGTYGIVSAINSTTSITLAFGVNMTSGPAATGSTYDIYCPVLVMGNGAVGPGESGGDEFGIVEEDMAFDANNKDGVIPVLNWFAQQHSYLEDVNVYNYCGIGLDVEGKWTQHSGTYDKVSSYPGSCASSTTLPIVVRSQAGIFGLRSLSFNKGMSSSNPAIGLDLEGTNLSASHVDAEQVGIGVGINENPNCTPACIYGVWGNAQANGIKVDSVDGAGTTAVAIANTYLEPTNITITNIVGGGFTNVLTDAGNSCTDVTGSPEYVLGQYVLNGAAKISSLTSSVAGCMARLPSYTVATLPAAASSAGVSVIVTDSASYTPGTCTGSGSDTMIAISNGTAWSCH